ncbi:MAG: c-type cytochrome [Gammaproteobacteria bacterium]|nr:c-type cytochrome [Gammaproteobacteria bacterium]MDH5594157.1 c-type cytochrome [Gammaproteobacteria bacterium]
MKYIINIVMTGLFLAGNVAYAIDSDRLLRKAQDIFEPLPDTMPGEEKDTPARIALGKKLFFDKRLSINNTQSCASCHKLENGFAGVDNLPVSPGAKGQVGTRNSPTVLNAGWQDSQFWDGRAENLVEQAKGPILNPIEMGMPDEASVVKKIQGITEYHSAFSSAFPNNKQAITYQNIAEAIASFERTLKTPSRFDDFLKGNKKALTQIEQQGLATFIKVNCVSCHDGVLLGGGTFEKLGKENPYSNQSDQGVYAISNDEEDRMVFKVASLRNVALTAPYFHDGKIATLSEAVRAMGKLQLDQDLTDRQVREITSFLKTLSDKNREK